MFWVPGHPCIFACNRKAVFSTKVSSLCTAAPSQRNPLSFCTTTLAYQKEPTGFCWLEGTELAVAARLRWCGVGVVAWALVARRFSLLKSTSWFHVGPRVSRGWREAVWPLCGGRGRPHKHLVSRLKGRHHGHKALCYLFVTFPNLLGERHSL